MSELTNPAFVLQKLIQCPSVTPEEGGALTMLENFLNPLGFMVERPVFKDNNTPDVENLYARLGQSGPHLMFAGHTDVVPVGNAAAWSHPPFGAEINNGKLYGRGAVDMKGGIACFIAALARYLENNRLNGSVSLLITGDEEGPAINGTIKLLQWAAQKGEVWDAALVGEPTNPTKLGEMIKVGRRGSLSGIITVKGRQGHVAYPERAANPLPLALKLCEALTRTPLDQGTAFFQPSNLELTSIDTGNTATNVIPADVSVRFNIRYNDAWTSETLKSEIEKRLQQAAQVTHQATHQAAHNGTVTYHLDWVISPGGVFLTENDRLVETLAKAIVETTGQTAERSTSGGTSDARFIKDYCPVVEFGLVGQTMHMVDECVALDDLETLTRIYQNFIESYFQPADK